jgi:hypothetical protein
LPHKRREGHFNKLLYILSTFFSLYLFYLDASHSLSHLTLSQSSLTHSHTLSPSSLNILAYTLTLFSHTHTFLPQELIWQPLSKRDIPTQSPSQDIAAPLRTTWSWRPNHLKNSSPAQLCVSVRERDREGGRESERRGEREEEREERSEKREWREESVCVGRGSVRDIKTVATR